MKLISKALQRNKPLLLDAALSALEEEIKRKQTAPNRVLGIPTGFSDLDNLLSGLRRGDLIAIGARPAMGTTSLALNIATHVAVEQKLPVIFFSMSKSSVLVAETLVRQTKYISSYRLATGSLEPEDLKNLNLAVERLRGSEFFIDDTPALNVNQIGKRVREIADQTGKLGLIVIDDLQCMSPLYAAKRPDKDYKEVMSSLRALAQEVDAPIVILSGLNRKLEKRKYKWPCLRDWPIGGIVENSDVSMTLYRDELYFPDSQEKGTAELMVCRNPHGLIGRVKLNFDGERPNFQDYSDSNQTIRRNGRSKPVLTPVD